MHMWLVYTHDTFYNCTGILHSERPLENYQPSYLIERKRKKTAEILTDYQGTWLSHSPGLWLSHSPTGGTTH